MYREDAFEIMVRQLQAEPEDVGLVYCDVQKVDENGRYLSTWYQGADPEKALFPSQEVGLCVMWRRKVYETVGPFRPLFDFAEDYDFYLRVSRQYRLARCGSEAPFFFRCHPSQNGTVAQRKQAVTYALAQLAHHCAIVRQHPTRLRCWKGVCGGAGRVAAWTLRYRWDEFLMGQKPR